MTDVHGKRKRGGEVKEEKGGKDVARFAHTRAHPSLPIPMSVSTVSRMNRQRQQSHGRELLTDHLDDACLVHTCSPRTVVSCVRIRDFPPRL